MLTELLCALAKLIAGILWALAGSFADDWRRA